MRMDENNLKVDRELLRTVTADTRVDILKALENRPMTASELSRFLARHVTTIAEHLDLLKNSNLVERVERPGRKWIYYKLTKEGRKVLHPQSYKWVIGVSIVFLLMASTFLVWNADAYPGQLLYPVKRARENLQLAMTVNSVDRASKHMNMAEERLKEAKAVSGRQDPNEMMELIDEYVMQIKEVQREIGRAMTQNIDVGSVIESMSESTPKQAVMLEHLMEKIPQIDEKLRPGINASMMHGQEALMNFRNFTGMKSVCNIPPA